MYTLNEIRKILNIQEQDRNEDSWSDEDAIETNEGDGKPFTPFELAILKLIHQNLTKGNMEDVLRDHAYPGDVGKKWINIAKLVGLRHSIQQGHSIDDIAYDKRYVKWALDNWTEDGDYASIEKPIKVPPKRYEVDREESGSQILYKDGSTTVVAYDEDMAGDTADNQFWDWGGEMETADYGDYETYDSEITAVRPLEVLSEEKQKEFNELVKLCQLGEKYTPKMVGGVTRETLTQFLKENINDMVYRDEPKEKHVRRMNRPLGPLEGFPIEKFKNMPPPKNESTETEEEIDYLDSIPVEKGFVDSADDVDGHFKKFLEPKGLEFPTEELKDVMKGVKSIILQLKYHYNRPRPYQVADAKNLKLDSENLKSASTPSYPSGHATQGTFLGRYLADLYPEYEKELRQIGEDIAFSRNMAKVHYPSDSEFGKMLGNDLYEFVYQPEEELNEQVESSSEDGEDKLLVPVKALQEYGDKYLKEDFKKVLTNVLECVERTCYQIGEQPYFLSTVDEDGESVTLQSTCDDCTRLLDETLQTLDAELIKMGFLKANENGILVKPFPKEYNRWIEDIMQEINSGFFIDDNDEVSYKDLGNAYDAYYDLSEQISPEALQDLYAFHGEELELDERKFGEKIKGFTQRKKEDLKKFWFELTKGAKRERKETAEAVKILARLIKNRDSVTKEDITFLKQQSGDIARIIALISLGAVSVVIPVGLEKLLNQYGISIMPKQRGKDKDGNGIDDYIDVTQDDNLLNESKQELNPELKQGDFIRIYNVDKDSPIISREGYTDQDRYMMYGGDSIPEIFKVYVVMMSTTHKRMGREGEKNEKIYVLLGPDMNTRRLVYLIPTHDTWVKIPREEGMEEFKDNLESYRIMNLDESDPKTGTGKKPKGSGRRLYTDEDPSDTVSVKFRTKEDIVDTLNKPSFKSKSHKRQSQIINLIHQRVRAAHKNAKDPKTKKRLKRALDYITNKKERSKEKTKRLNKLNESTQTNQPLNRGDEIMIVDLDHTTQGYSTGRRPQSSVTPDTFKPYRIFGVTHRQRENWEGPDADTRIYQLEPVDITDEERTQDLISGGGRRRGLHMIPGDTWILQKRPENWYDNLHESKQEEISPRLEIGDKIKVIEIDGEHDRMPELFTTVYKVVRKSKKRGEALVIDGYVGDGEWYDLIPAGYEDEVFDGLVGKTIYHGDVWIKVNSSKELESELGEQPNEAARTLANTRKHGIGTRFSKPAIKANPQRFRKYTRDKYLQEETDIFGQGLMNNIKPEEFEGTDEEWEEMVTLNSDEVLDIEDDYEYIGGKTDPSTGFVAPSKEVTNNICKVKGFCKAQGPITFGQLRELVKAASSQRLKSDMGRGTFRELWRIVPFFIPQVLLAAVGAELARVINKIISPALKDAGSYKSWWGQVVMKTMNVAEGTAFPNMVLGDDPLTKVFFISDGLLHMISDKYKLKFAKYVADVAASKPDNEPVPDWFVENLLRDYLNQKFLLDPPLPVKVSDEPLSEQQFPFNPNNKDIERDHPEGEPDWSIRRGDQHYSMNVENTPNEPVAAFNNYLVKNSPFIIEGFDFYLSAVPGNMPQSAIVDVYVPMMDDSAVADDIWNKDRIYYQKAEDGSSDRMIYQGRKEKLHNLDYDQKFPEFTYYEYFQDRHPEYIEYLEKEVGDTNLLNEPGAQYEMIWRTKRMNLQKELDSMAKLFGVSGVRINRDPRKPWKRQRDSYNNEKIRPGKLVPRGWPRP